MTTATGTAVLYQLDHLSARFRVQPVVDRVSDREHDLLGIDLPLRDWIALGRPSTLTLTISTDHAAPASGGPPYKVGDPDPTPDLMVDGYCQARGPQEGRSCTWQVGHDGPHVAGNGTIIVETWES